MGWKHTRYIILIAPILVKRAQTAIEQKFENDFFQSVQNALEKKKENNKNLTQRASEGINITKKKQSFGNLGINIGIGIAKFYFSLQEFFLVK